MIVILIYIYTYITPLCPLHTHVYTSQFSTGKPNPCNAHIYHVHASESFNVKFFNFKGVIINSIFTEGVDDPIPPAYVCTSYEIDILYVTYQKY